MKRLLLLLLACALAACGSAKRVNIDGVDCVIVDGYYGAPEGVDCNWPDEP